MEPVKWPGDPAQRDFEAGHGTTRRPISGSPRSQAASRSPRWTWCCHAVN